MHFPLGRPSLFAVDDTGGFQGSRQTSETQLQDHIYFPNFKRVIQGLTENLMLESSPENRVVLYILSLTVIRSVPQDGNSCLDPCETLF